MIFRITIFAVLTGIFAPAVSQDSIENAQQSFQEIITEIASQSEDEANLDELADRLYALSENPVAVNSASAEELGRLFWLNYFQIQNLDKYVDSLGPLTSVYEIMYIEGFDEKDAKLLAPFVSFEIQKEDVPVSPGLALQQGHHKILLRSARVLEKQKGYDGSFEGGPASVYTRYSFQWENKILAGFTGESDAGETFMKKSNRNGFDFNSFYLQVSPGKFVKNIIAGDYRLSFGQGLNVGSGLNLFKTSAGLGSMGRSTGISRYQSTDENRFFRGVAATFKLKPVEWSLWYSVHPMDGNVTQADSVTHKATVISSLPAGGIHALPSEIRDEDAIFARATGANISLVRDNFIGGITGLYYSFSASLNPRDEAYNRYYFRGKSGYNLSIDYRYRLRSMIFFGEEAVSQSGGVAMLNGIQTYVNSKLSLSIISRYYRKNYQAMYGSAFGENSVIANESGIFASFEMKVVKYTTINGYVDVYHFPWVTYSADMPSSGRDFMGQITFSPEGIFQFSIQYRNKTREVNYSNSAKMNGLELLSTRKLRLNLKYPVTKIIQLDSRMEWSNYHPEYSTSSKGFMASQDLEISFGRFPVKTILRYMLFHTDDYNSRIYAYEDDLLYTFSIPAFYDKGFRTYVLLRCSPLKSLDLWVKYAILQYEDRETTGSGLYEIQGNRRSDLKVQAFFKF